MSKNGYYMERGIVMLKWFHVSIGVLYVVEAVPAHNIVLGLLGIAYLSLGIVKIRRKSD